MKILYIGEEGYGNLEWSFRHAFEQLGCEVRFVDTTGRSLWGHPGQGVISRVARKVLSGLIQRQVASRIISSGRGVDLIFCHKTLNVNPALIAQVCAENSALLFCYYPDHPLDGHPSRSNQNTLSLIPMVNLFYIFSRQLIPLLESAGARRVEWLPFAYDERLSVQPPVEPSGDIVFVGSFSEERAVTFSPLLDLDFGIWGPGWQKAFSIDERFRRCVRGSSLTGKEMVRAYAGAKIGLNLVQSCQGGDGHNMRTMEVLASGCMLLTNFTQEQAELFVENREIVFFRGTEDLAEKATNYLDENEERKSIARAGLSAVRKETYLNRAERILRAAREPGWKGKLDEAGKAGLA